MNEPKKYITWVETHRIDGVDVVDVYGVLKSLGENERKMKELLNR